MNSVEICWTFCGAGTGFVGLDITRGCRNILRIQFNLFSNHGNFTWEKELFQILNQELR